MLKYLEQPKITDSKSLKEDMARIDRSRNIEPVTEEINEEIPEPEKHYFWFRYYSKQQLEFANHSELGGYIILNRKLIAKKPIDRIDNQNVYASGGFPFITKGFVFDDEGRIILVGKQLILERYIFPILLIGYVILQFF